jgi:hypothetical protein
MDAGGQVLVRKDIIPTHQPTRICINRELLRISMNSNRFQRLKTVTFSEKTKKCQTSNDSPRFRTIEDFQETMESKNSKQF